jgi:hypothetical protein
MNGCRVTCGRKTFAKQLLTGVLSIAEQSQARYHKQGDLGFLIVVPFRSPRSPLFPPLIPPNPHLQPRAYLPPPPVASPSPPTPLQTEAAQEDDNPDQRAVRRGVDKRSDSRRLDDTQRALLDEMPTLLLSDPSLVLFIWILYHRLSEPDLQNVV